MAVATLVHVYDVIINPKTTVSKKLATSVEGDQKAPFSNATPFPRMLYFTLDPYHIMLSVKQGRIKYHFLSL